jgi:hypothetical protein
MIINNHETGSSSSSITLCGQLEKSTSPSGFIGVNTPEPKAFSLSESLSPEEAYCAISANKSSPQSLKI